MQRNSYRMLLPAALVFIILIVGCSSPAPAPTPTDTPAPTAIPATATNTTVPTSTPRPTATPNLAATQAMQDAEAHVGRYVDAGYFGSSAGRFFPLDDLQKDLAQINYLDVAPNGYDSLATNFAMWADIKQESAGTVNYPEFSGCGFVFRYQDSGDYYALLTKDSIVMAYCLAAGGGKCGRAGKTRGTGTVDLGSPFDAHFELVLNGNHAYTLVNGEFVGEYTLFADKLMTPGYIGYGIISGTNKDYGTRCTFTNGTVWIPNE